MLPFKASFRPILRQATPSPVDDARRPPSSASSRSAVTDPPPFDLDDPRVEPDEPDLRELNASLDVLVTIFPDVQPDVFREMLASFSEESRLEVVTEAMLRHPARWVRGRHRPPRARELAEAQRKRQSSDKGDAPGALQLPVEEKFRSEAYKLAVKESLYQEFKGLSHSAIRAVLAECNYSYTQARPTLLALLSKSWRFSFTSFFTRRKAPLSAQDHPLVAWQKPDPETGGVPVPRLVPTKNKELNKELYETLIAPVLAKQTEERMAQDRALAEQLNDEEAEAAGGMMDCECCFTPSSFEHLSYCDGSGHWICLRCIRFSVHEALYGQGWARSINTERLTLFCIAPADGNCTGCLPQDSVRRALAEEEDGEATFHKLEERVATDALLKSQLPLVRCPFCAYAEVDDLNLPLHAWKPKSRRMLGISILSTAHFLYLEPINLLVRFIALFSLFFLMLNYLLPSRHRLDLTGPLVGARKRVARRRRGLKFTCGSPHCGRASCINCHKPWRDIHKCHESALASLRNHVENAVSNAIKRTCPSCNTSFVKSEGCNKLVCVCGYIMCYVCRQRIAPDEGYKHFCNHFRADNPGPGQPCDSCSKCHLYEEEDTERVMRRAALQAEQEWKAANGGVGVTVKEGVLLRGPGLGAKGADADIVGLNGASEWEEWLDWALDCALA